MEQHEHERELVPIKVRPLKREQEAEEFRPLEELPDHWKPQPLPRRWVNY